MRHLSLGGVNLRRDLGASDGNPQTLNARSLGFFGKSAIHPRQLATLHDAFTPSGLAERLPTRVRA